MDEEFSFADMPDHEPEEPPPPEIAGFGGSYQGFHAPEVEGGVPYSPPTAARGSTEDISREIDLLNQGTNYGGTGPYPAFNTDQVARTLSAYGWNPDSARSMAEDVPIKYGWLGDNTYGEFNIGGNNSGDITINPDSFRVPWESQPEVVEHEFHHAADWGNPNMQRAMMGVEGGRNTLKEDMLREVGNQSYPEGARAIDAAAVHPQPGQQPIMPVGAPWDPGHANHNIINQASFDYSAFSPEYAQRYFPYAAYAPAEVSQDYGQRLTWQQVRDMTRAQEAEQAQIAMAKSNPVYTQEILDLLQRRGEQTPWWEGVGNYDPNVPPGVYGQYDKLGPSEFYPFDEDGNPVPYSRER